MRERTEAWKRERKSMTYYDQTRELAELRRECAEYASYSVEVLREPLRRVNLAFRGFFRRVRAGERPGYPRFRSPERYNSFAVSEFRLQDHGLIQAETGRFEDATSSSCAGDTLACLGDQEWKTLAGLDQLRNGACAREARRDKRRRDRCGLGKVSHLVGGAGG